MSDSTPTPTPMTLVLVGPMTGYREFNFPRFHEVEYHLSKMGHTVLSPARRDVDQGFDPTGMKGHLDELEASGFDLREAMLDNLYAIMSPGVDGVVLLEVWWRSRGSIAEVAAALQFNKSFYVIHGKNQLARVTVGLEPLWSMEEVVK